MHEAFILVVTRIFLNADAEEEKLFNKGAIRLQRKDDC